VTLINVPGSVSDPDSKNLRLKGPDTIDVHHCGHLQLSISSRLLQTFVFTTLTLRDYEQYPSLGLQSRIYFHYDRCGSTSTDPLLNWIRQVMEGIWRAVRAFLALQLCLCYGSVEGLNIDLGSTRKYLSGVLLNCAPDD
jgi:hypothetical protein